MSGSSYHIPRIRMSHMLSWCLSYIFSLTISSILIILLRKEDEKDKPSKSIVFSLFFLPVLLSFSDGWTDHLPHSSGKKKDICDVLFLPNRLLFFTILLALNIHPTITCFTILSLHCCLIQDQSPCLLKLRKLLRLHSRPNIMGKNREGLLANTIKQSYFWRDFSTGVPLVTLLLRVTHIFDTIQPSSCIGYINNHQSN